MTNLTHLPKISTELSRLLREFIICLSERRSAAWQGKLRIYRSMVRFFRSCKFWLVQNGKILSYCLPYRLDDLPMESNAVFHRLGAILIRSVVGQRGEKLIEEITVSRVQLYSVKTCLFCSKSCLSKPFGNLPDLLESHLRRQFFLLLGVIDRAGTYRGLSGDFGQRR